MSTKPSPSLFKMCSALGRASVFIAFSAFATAHAQTAEPNQKFDNISDYEVESLEKTLDNNTSSSGTEQLPNIRVEKSMPTLDYKQINTTLDLKDVVVIQKISMPKTKRFQLFAGLSMITNDQFYQNSGAHVRLGYYLTEKWGIELSSLFLSHSKSSDLSDLEKNQKTEADKFNSPRSYMGVDIYFSSMYGKMALYDRNIYPFEFYQSFGFGHMKTQLENSTLATRVSIGQLFTRSRSDGFRWDLGFYLYPEKDKSSGQTQTSQSLNLTLGWGLLFPGVKR